MKHIVSLHYEESKASKSCHLQGLLQEILQKSKHFCAKKIVWTLELIEDIDQVPETYLKHLTGTDGLYEVRVSISSNVYRIFCFFSGEQFGCSYERLSKEDSENAKIRNNKSIKNKRRV